MYNRIKSDYCLFFYYVHTILCIPSLCVRSIVFDFSTSILFRFSEFLFELGGWCVSLPKGPVLITQKIHTGLWADLRWSQSADFRWSRTY